VRIEREEVEKARRKREEEADAMTPQSNQVPWNHEIYYYIGNMFREAVLKLSGQGEGDGTIKEQDTSAKAGHGSCALTENPQSQPKELEMNI